MTDVALAPAPLLTVASRALERLGWELCFVDLDLVAERGRVQVKRFDGVLVTLDADKRLGRASLTRERVVTRRDTFRPDARGPSVPVDRCTTEFIGRTKYDGVRSAARALADYIGDNPQPGLKIENGRKHGRVAMRAVLGSVEA